MSRHGIRIGRIFGISIDLDYSWFLIVGLVTWTLAESYFPADFPGWTRGDYWRMGLAAAIFFHELGHSVLARSLGLLNHIAFLDAGSRCCRAAPGLKCARMTESWLRWSPQSSTLGNPPFLAVLRRIL